jgi:hypothetical protein
MHADMDETLHLRIEGTMAGMLQRIDPELYGPYLTEERGKPVIYLKLEKALYGTLQAALLFWRNLSGFLMEQGFEANPYDPCVMNKIINGSQCTVGWHVDDLKLSHAQECVLDELIGLINAKYGSEDAPVTVTKGKVHDYLGMTLDYSQEGKVAIRMDEYVAELLMGAPPEMEGVASTPAANYVYEVDPQVERLDATQADLFHTMTAKLLFLCK